MNNNDKEDITQKIIELIENTKEPVSIDYVVHNLKITYNLKTTWQTTRALLLDMSLQKKIIAEKTTKSWIFRPLPKKGD